MRLRRFATVALILVLICTGIFLLKDTVAAALVSRYLRSRCGAESSLERLDISSGGITLHGLRLEHEAFQTVVREAGVALSFPALTVLR